MLLVACAFVAATVHAPAALAATPCWKTLLNDWYDGRIDQSYSVHCYHDALKHLPSDVQTYSSAHDDILRALQTAIAKQKKGNKTVGNNTLVPPQRSGGSSGGGDTPTTTTTVTGTGSPGNKGNGGLAGQLNPSSPSSLPVPLLVLGGLALLLVAAGAAGLIAKRVQARRPGA
ncbi:MAG: hypothetical protein H0X39_04780 [Actinobacteria bacterium]|nr:hypothetical protein [Actinomycetota bacterium]